MPQLNGWPCFAFTDQAGLLGQYKDRVQKGGGVLELDLNAVGPSDKGYFAATMDWHVATDAVFSLARELSPEEIEQTTQVPPAALPPARRSFKGKGNPKPRPS